MKPEPISKESWDALKLVSDDDDFLRVTSGMIKFARDNVKLGLADEYNIPQKEIRKKLDAAEKALNDIPYVIQSEIPGLEDVIQSLRSPLEKSAPPRRRPEPERFIVLMCMKIAFDGLKLPITTYDDGPFVRTAEIACQELGIKADGRELARDAAENLDNSHGWWIQRPVKPRRSE